MNDRFKFRAWNKVMKYMAKDMAFRIDKEGNLWTGTQSANNFELIQSTGLKDSKGTLIFEGDIILLNAYGDDLIAPVVWDGDDSSFMLEHPNGYHGHYGFTWKIIDSCKEFKIIGNIYESPELLKDTQ